jgi:drug/metabolite transporter (DMT)-like permease
MPQYKIFYNGLKRITDLCAAMGGNNGFIKWGLFIVLSFIWGSSFILMLIGLKNLNAWQVAALRLFSAGLVMLPFAWKALKKIPRPKIQYAILSGVLGSFFPAFLFCLAETRLDSSFAGTLNSLTPIFVLAVGIFFFNLKVSTRQVAGIIISFSGSILLFLAKDGKTGDLIYVGFIVLATFLYGLNVNMVSRKLKEVASVDIGALAFSFLIIPSGLILFFFNTHEVVLSQSMIHSLLASAALGVMGTTVASILFYILLKKAGSVFASTVTYGIPFVAILLGLINHEKITLAVVGSLLIILLGIFIANAKEKPMQVLLGLFRSPRQEPGK